MRRVLFLGGLLLSLNAFAFDARQMSYDGKAVTLTDVDPNKGMQIKASSIKHGVYILVADSFVSITIVDDPDYKATTALIRKFFEAKGIKTLDTPDNADYAITFSMQKGYAMGDVEKNVSADKAGSANMDTAITVLTGGVTSLISFGSGKKMLGITGIRPNPKKTERRGHPTVDPGDGEKITYNTLEVDYKLDDKNEATYGTLFKMFLDQWVASYFVQDVAPAAGLSAPPAASAVSLTQPVSTASK